MQYFSRQISYRASCLRRHTCIFFNIPRYFGNDEVLRVLNSATEEKLCHLKLSKQCSSALLSYRNEHGDLTNVNCLLNISGFSKNTITNLRKEIRGDNKPSYISPVLSQDQCKEINDIVGIHVKLPNIAVVLLTREGEIQAWETVQLFSKLPEPDFHQLHSVAKEIMPKIPLADVYLVEPKRNIRVKDSVQFVWASSEKMFEVILMTLLKKDTETESNVVTVNDTFVCKHFDLKIGGERVSGHPLVETLIRPDEDGKTKLSVNREQLKYYKELTDVDQEFICNALLLAIAFNDVILNGK